MVQEKSSSFKQPQQNSKFESHYLWEITTLIWHLKSQDLIISFYAMQSDRGNMLPPVCFHLRVSKVRWNILSPRTGFLRETLTAIRDG